jgi:putative tricarboxylic transport membrane protein
VVNFRRRIGVGLVVEGKPVAPASKNFTFRVRAPRDFFGGLALVVLALAAIWAGSDLPGQQGFAFGPGTAPRMFAGLLALVGAGIAFGGLLTDGPAIGGYAIRGPALVLAGILAFAVTIRPLGLVPASYLTFLVSIIGSSEMRWVESLIAASVMTAFCVALFVYLLQLPFQLWPWFI